MFINFFNLFNNKLSGKQSSLGLIALNCLNIPPRLQYQTKYTCQAGLIPSPNQPTMIKIDNVLIPLKIAVKLATLVGDIAAVHKAEGFKSNLATKSFPWCDFDASNPHKVALRHPCTGRKVLDAAQSWKDTPSEFSQEKLAMRTGIFWLELNYLPYWDPVLNVTLGVMHNWFEGVPKNHFISQWRFNYINISQELDNLEASETFQESPGEDRNMCTYKEINNEDSGYLTEDIKRRIQEQICKVIVSKGVTQIPPLVGKSQVGKLKASGWNSLFSLYLPMVFLEVMWEIAINNYTPDLFAMLLNFGALLQCTNIVGAKAIKQEDSTRFSENYKKYQKTSLKLFPKYQHVPNHHYAMNIPDQLNVWGPPMGILEL
ncbi:hypothetical protein O181_010832 [Austropuccinia psidii MF-1]|uniref:Uncharacterized protein n=1 Tax=Austropuccinia psidii MF-1 TaxID=1389203 RepID=A0A9Q3GLK8_9BASI|nr:hypothetical protein [Austropuccinia psidii MF-1]